MKCIVGVKVSLVSLWHRAVSHTQMHRWSHCERNTHCMHKNQVLFRFVNTEDIKEMAWKRVGRVLCYNMQIKVKYIKLQTNKLNKSLQCFRDKIHEAGFLYNGFNCTTTDRQTDQKTLWRRPESIILCRCLPSLVLQF